jgi:[protein-PII] uridylyltransferase
VTGSRALFDHLVGTVIAPYFKRSRKKYLKAMLTALDESTSTTTDTLLRIEPDIKNGICCLRDCQRLLWAERVGSGTCGGDRAPGSRFLGQEYRRSLEACATMLAKLRIELHMLCGRRLDVLEIALQPAVARSLGYDGGPAALMGDFFRTVKTVRQCMRACIENLSAEFRPLNLLRSSIASFSAGRGLRMIDGVLHPDRRSVHRYDHDVEWIISVFATALRCRAGIGMDLRNRIVEAARSLTPADFRTGPVEKIMCDILSAPSDAGRIIGLMFEMEILELLLPEFAPISCKVEFDTYHEFTVDQHSLLAMQAVDALAGESDPLAAQVYRRVTNLRVLRLALLLHDAGKALDGDHCRSGAIIVRNAAARLGFDADEQRLAEFLVYHHLDLSELSLRREIEDDSVRQFARTVRSRETLDLLYLLTVLDIRHVGSKTWTGWKAMQLADIFTRTESMLARPPFPDAIAPSRDDPDEASAGKMPEDIRTLDR